MSAPRAPLRAVELTLELGERPWLMGIVNASPDSFSDGGAARDASTRSSSWPQSCSRAGADILDIGGESATHRPPAGRCRRGDRAGRAARRARRRRARRARVGRHLQAGGRARGDRRRRHGSSTTSAACATRRWPSVCAQTGAALVLMHTRAAPARAPAGPRPLRRHHRRGARLPARARRAWRVARGVAPEQLILDPGPGLRQDARADDRAAGAASRACTSSGVRC